MEKHLKVMQLFHGAVRSKSLIQTDVKTLEYEYWRHYGEHS